MLRTVEAVAATGVATVVMTYWNPVLAYGAGAVRPRPRLGGRLGPDHAGPDPRRGRRVARRQRRPRPGPDLPGGAVLDRRPDRLDRRRRAAAGSTPPRRWASPAPGRRRRASRRRWSDGYASRLVAAGRRSGSASPTATQAAEVAAYADGVIVGSALVRCLLDADSEAAGARRAWAHWRPELAAGVRTARPLRAVASWLCCPLTSPARRRGCGHLGPVPIRAYALCIIARGRRGHGRR